MYGQQIIRIYALHKKVEWMYIKTTIHFSLFYANYHFKIIDNNARFRLPPPYSFQRLISSVAQLAISTAIRSINSAGKTQETLISHNAKSEE